MTAAPERADALDRPAKRGRCLPPADDRRWSAQSLDCSEGIEHVRQLTTRHSRLPLFRVVATPMNAGRPESRRSGRTVVPPTVGSSSRRTNVAGPET